MLNMLTRVCQTFGEKIAIKIVVSCSKTFPDRIRGLINVVNTRHAAGISQPAYLGCFLE